MRAQEPAFKPQENDKDNTHQGYIESTESSSIYDVGTVKCEKLQGVWVYSQIPLTSWLSQPIISPKDT